MRALAFGLALAGIAASLSGEEVKRTPGRQTLYDMRQLGSALFYWQMAQMDAWSPEERETFEQKEKLRLEAAKKAAIARGDYVDPDSMTPKELLSHVRPLPGDLGETKRLSLEQVTALLQRAGSKPLLESVPAVDGWGRSLEVWIDLDNLLNRTVIAIRSSGPNGRFQEPPYSPGAYEVGAELDDLIWIDGWFYRWQAGDEGPLTPTKMGTLMGLVEDDGL